MSVWDVFGALGVAGVLALVGPISERVQVFLFWVFNHHGARTGRGGGSR